MSDKNDAETSPHPIWYLVILIAAGCSSAAIALFVKGGIGDIRKLEQKKEKLRQVAKKRRKRLRELRQREKRLHQDPHLIEQLAREKLGLRQPGVKRVRFENKTDSGVDGEISRDEVTLSPGSRESTNE
ncbi:MAG: septum formation initiator family protein [bacterium]